MSSHIHHLNPGGTWCCEAYKFTSKVIMDTWYKLDSKDPNEDLELLIKAQRQIMEYYESL